MPERIVGIVGYRSCEDGVDRAVYLDCAGKQFLFDERGKRIYGTWYVPGADPAITTAEDTLTVQNTEATIVATAPPRLPAS